MEKRIHVTNIIKTLTKNGDISHQRTVTEKRKFQRVKENGNTENPQSLRELSGYQDVLAFGKVYHDCLPGMPVKNVNRKQRNKNVRRKFYVMTPEYKIICFQASGHYISCSSVC